MGGAGFLSSNWLEGSGTAEGPIGSLGGCLWGAKAGLQSYNVFGVGRWSRHFSFLPVTDQNPKPSN